MTTLAERAKKARKKSKLTQAEAAKKIGIKQPSLSDIETGKTKSLDQSTLMGMASTYNILPHLLTGSAEPTLEIAIKEAEINIIDAGFNVTYVPTTTNHTWDRWAKPSFLVTKPSHNLSVYVEVHPDKKLLLPMNPTDSKEFVYIKFSETSNAGQILKEHFEKYGNQIKEDQAEDLVDSLQNTGTLRNSYKTVPVVGMAQLGDNGYFEEQQYPVGHGDGYIDTPTTDPNAYGLKVVGDSMHPAIRHGWYVVIEPNLEPFNGMIALFKFKDGRKMIKELANTADGFYTLLSINEDHKRITASIEEIEDIHPVAFIAPPNKVKHP